MNVAGTLRARGRLWSLKRRLRKLQNDYLRASAKDDALILTYLQVLAEARQLCYSLSGGSDGGPREDGLVCVHLGAGDHHLSGWVNVDLSPSPAVDFTADLATGIPVKSGSVDFIHSEDFLEHLDLEAGKRVLGEAFRILRPGGVMRVLTPNLRSLVKRLYLGRSRRDLQWCASYVDAPSPCEALNMHLRMFGEHRFVYDKEYLVALLRDVGFTVRATSYNRSTHLPLRFLDLRDFKLNMFLECEKPH